jgi:hypothetical protein
VPAAAGGRIKDRWCTAYYADTLAALPASLSANQVDRDDLLLDGDDKIRIYLTPFDGYIPHARVVLVGLTPGRQQMHLAVTTAGAVLRQGGSVDEAIAAAKVHAAFAGTMRTNLIRMLDGIGLHTALGLETCQSLFQDRSDLVSNTSAICHATFLKNGDNYRGVPAVSRHPLLRAFAQQVLDANLSRTPDALIIPLGKAATEAVRLTSVDPRRVLFGFPHPSGGNGHRHRLYAEAQEQLSKGIIDWFS